LHAMPAYVSTRQHMSADAREYDCLLAPFLASHACKGISSSLLRY
jgi:hypothetical protein